MSDLFPEEFKSYQMMMACRGSTLRPTVRLLLWAMALRAGKDGYCWASIATLMDDTALGERTVQDALKILLEHKVITSAISKWRTSNYKLHIDAVPKGERPRVTRKPRTGAALAPEGAALAPEGAALAPNPSWPSREPKVPSPTPPLRGGALNSNAEWVANVACDTLTNAENAEQLAFKWSPPDAELVCTVFDNIRGVRVDRFSHTKTRGPPMAGCPVTLRKRDVEKGLVEGVRRWREKKGVDAVARRA